MTKKLLPMMLAFAFALAGCLGDGEVDAGDDVDLLLADVTGGSAPLNVTFSLDNVDPGVNWTLQLGDGESESGNGLPTTVEHTYMMPGNFTVEFFLDDSETPDADLTISVMGEFGITQEHTGGWMITSPVYCALAGDIVEPLNGIFTEWINVNPESKGHPFGAMMTSAQEAGILDYLVQFANSDGEFTIVETFTGSPGEPIMGIVPDDADRVYFTACGISGPVEVMYVAV